VTAFEYSVRDHDLPAGAHRIPLLGSPRTLVWPEICPNCGAPASEQIPVCKIFRRTEGSPNDRFIRYLITRVDIPFCAACAERHRQSARMPTRSEAWLSYLRSPAIIALVAAAGFAILLFRPLLIETRGDASAGRVGLALFGLLVLAAMASVIFAWRETRFLRVPGQTEITRACDFSDNLGNVIVGERRVYAIRNAAFAEAFATANQDHLWTDALRMRDRRRYAAFALLVLGALLASWLMNVL
jgi:hypothetical protein